MRKTKGVTFSIVSVAGSKITWWDASLWIVGFDAKKKKKRLRIDSCTESK